MTIELVRGSEVGELRERVDAELAGFIGRQDCGWPDGAPRGVLDKLRRFVLAGGRRLRPMFCYWGWCGAGQPDGVPIVAAAAALEFFHTFALLHDDLLGGGDRRGGEPPVHRLFADLHARSSWRGDPATYRRSAALVCGDLCAAWADQMLHESGLPGAQLLRGYAAFSAMRTEVIAGQYLDLVSGVGDGSVASTLTVVRMKAARCTVTRPLQIGAALAGADPGLAAAYAAFGDPLGDALQLREDVLAVFGDPQVAGGSILDDLREGTPTVLLALTREGADRAQAARLRSLSGSPELDAAGAGELRALITGTGARDRIEQMIKVNAEAALAALAGAPVTAGARAALAALTESTVDGQR